MVSWRKKGRVDQRNRRCGREKYWKVWVGNFSMLIWRFVSIHLDQVAKSSSVCNVNDVESFFIDVKNIKFFIETRGKKDEKHQKKLSSHSVNLRTNVVDGFSRVPKDQFFALQRLSCATNWKSLQNWRIMTGMKVTWLDWFSLLCLFPPSLISLLTIECFFLLDPPSAAYAIPMSENQ